MKPESLDALLLDRAFGELPVETAELLEAHLTQNPEAAAHAAAWEASMVETRTALGYDDPRGEPARGLSVLRAGWQHEDARQRWLQLARNASRLAAGVAAGLGLGWLLFAPAGPSFVPSPHLASTTHMEARAPVNAAQRFWSRDTFLGRSEIPSGEAPGAEGRPPWRWVSPPTSSQEKAGS